MNKESFSPEQKAAVVDLIKRVDPYRNAMVFGQAVIEVSKQFGFHPLAQIEELLREMQSDTYLLAVPFTSEMSDFTAKLPHSGAEEYPNYLWICVNGSEEAEEKMLEIETTSDQNVRDLVKTGVLVAKPKSNISNAMHSHLN